MESDRLNRWLTFGANVGVLIGIILILMELNQNSELMRAQMTQARADNVLESYRAQMHSDSWAEIRAKRRSAISIEEWISQLSPAEFEKVFYSGLHELHSIRIQYTQYRAGYIDEDTWNYSAKAQARRLVEILPYMPFTATNDPEFRKFLNEIAIEAGLPLIGAED